LALVLNALGLPTRAATPVSQAWAVRITAPTNAVLQSSSMSVGPSGDVFLASHVRRSGFNYDLLISRRSPSGAPVWERYFEPVEGSSGNERALNIVARGTNVYVAGSITSTTGNGSPDFLTVKYRDTGELEWAARLDGPGLNNDGATALAIDGLGNVLVLGGSIGPNGSMDIVVLKYGPTGNLLWIYSYDGPDHGPDRGVGLRVDAGGNVYVAGTSGPSSDESAVVILKLDPSGHELWTARETAGNYPGVTANSLDLDVAGNVGVVGVERSYGVTWKYDANGNRQWKARYRAEELASIYGRNVRFDANGDIITAANLYGSGTNDAVLVKYAGADGRQLWATRISSPDGAAHLNAMDVDGDGNSYLTTTPASDVITVKVSPNGAQLWAVTYNSQGFFSDYGEFLDVAASGDIVVAGRSVHFSENFTSLVKYTQQPVAGVATAVVRPALQVVDPGADVVFTAETTGPGPISWQWRRNGRPIPDATNATLALSSVQVFHRGDYSVIISNVAGATVSPEARLSVRTRPEVTITPTEAVGYLGSDAGFVATVVGNDFATMQWRHDGANISGATNDTLRVVALSAADGGAYDVVVSTSGGTTTSSTAGLRISGAVRLVGVTPHRSSVPSWDYAPQFQVLPTGESLIAARSNHVLGSSVVLSKHAAHGALLWTTTFESSEFTNAEPSHVALDGAGNIFVSALSRQPYINGAWAVLKFNPDGQLLWSRILTGTNVWGGVHAFAVDPQGHSVIGAVGATEMKVVRYDEAGEVVWTYVDPSPDNDTIAVAVDASGHTYLGTTIREEGDSEIRLRQFDATGALLWTRPDAEGHYNRLEALAVDAAGYLIVAGAGEWADVPNSRMFVQKYSSAGQKIWEMRTGSGWQEISHIYAMAVGPGGEITVLTMSDDDYELGEQSGVTRIGADGRLRYRIAEPQVLVSSPSQLALDDFGNVYVTGVGIRAGTGIDAVTAKYDSYGNRLWLVYHDGSVASWEYGLAVGADAVGDIRVLATVSSGSDSIGDFSLLHYRQADPAGRFRVQLIPDGAGTFHLGTPTEKPFRLEASADLQNWSALTEEETQRLLQPGATSFVRLAQRFFRLVLVE
jgi:hypothetical protein